VLSKKDNFDSAYSEHLIIPCEHTFTTGKNIRREYSPDLCDNIIDHGRSGLYLHGFAGKYNISVIDMCDWLSKPKEYPDFVTAVRISHSACIHYYNEELLHFMTLQDWAAVAQVKATLAELMKVTPKELTEGLYSNLSVQTAASIQEEEQRDKDAEFQQNIMGE
jgi:hypothetical protein